MDYEKPVLIELNAKVGSGQASCGAGSAATDTCTGGAAVTGGDCENGTTPGGFCTTGGSDVGS